MFEVAKHLSIFSIYKLNKLLLTGYNYKLPNFLIIGAPKCGTTSLHYYLSRHPDIFLPKQKELHFFSTVNVDKKLLKNELYPIEILLEKIIVNNFNDYKVHFLNAHKYKMVGEITPSYYIKPQRFAENVNLYLKDIDDLKLIILLRNPIEASLSHYNMQFNNGVEYLSFNDFLEVEDYRKKNNNYRRCHVDTYMYSDRIKYIKNKFKHIHIVKFEDFVKNKNRIHL